MSVVCLLELCNRSNRVIHAQVAYPPDKETLAFDKEKDTKPIEGGLIRLC
jgi:hypothetical protein